MAPVLRNAPVRNVNGYGAQNHLGAKNYPLVTTVNAIDDALAPNVGAGASSIGPMSKSRAVRVIA